MAVGSKGLCHSWLAAAAAVMALALPANAQQSPPGVRKPDSPWLQRERDRFQAWLGNHPADVPIAPFQVSGSGFDPVERTLMATQLADALSSRISLSIADPLLAGRALGEGLRIYSDADLQALAKRMRARFLVIGSAGHDQQSKFQVRIRVLRQGQSGAWEESGIQGLGFDCAH